MPPTHADSVRKPAVAGTFYPADATACRELAAQFIRPRDYTPVIAAQKRWIGGIVPHAGWICSGAVAGETIAAIAASGPPPDVVVVFGAIHTPLPIDAAALDSHARWMVPGGESCVPEALERKLAERGNLFRSDDRFHDREHAVEVELPLIQQAWPNATVLPIEVPLIEDALSIGYATAARIMSEKLRPVFLASSDLTHYGQNYGLAPAGLGFPGLRWAMENDQRLLLLVNQYQAEQIVPEVRGRMNACGGGAIAAMLAACREFGATEARVLRHTNSFQTLADLAPQSPNNAVGYAAVVVG
jgi:MEMO1 family protein